MITVRPAVSSDLDTLVHIAYCCMQTTYRELVDTNFLDTLTESITEPCIAVMLHRTYDVFVAEIDERVVGFAGWDDFTSPEYHQNRLQSLYVHPSSQGIGVGKALINRCAKCALENGYDGMMIGVFKANHRALSLYESLGAEYVEDEDYIIGGKTYLGSLMAWNDLDHLIQMTEQKA